MTKRELITALEKEGNLDGQVRVYYDDYYLHPSYIYYSKDTKTFTIGGLY